MSEPYYLVRRAQTVSEVIDGEAIVINMETGVYYSLSQAGVAVWETLQDGATASAVVASIRDRYHDVPENVPAIVSDLLARLEREGLVVVAAEPAPGKGPRATGADGGAKVPYEQPTLERYTDMQEFLLVDPIHEVTEEGWPNRKNPPPPGKL